jgi:hypothetical protein
MANKESDVTELARKAGISADDLDFLDSLMPRLIMGHLLGIRMFSSGDMKRVFSMYEKLQEVDPNAVPPEVLDLLKAVQDAAEGK